MKIFPRKNYQNQNEKDKLAGRTTLSIRYNSKISTNRVAQFGRLLLRTAKLSNAIGVNGRNLTVMSYVCD